MRSKRGSEGSILIIVLWSLFFLSLLAMAISSYVRPQLDLAVRMLYGAKMRYLARAGVERAIFEVNNDKTDEYDSLSDSWSSNDVAFNGVKLDGGTFSVTKSRRPSGKKEEYGLVDEERKININKAPYAVLKNLFVMAAELSDEDAGIIADCILDWRDRDDSLRKDGVEEDYYSFLSKPYHCKNGDFESAEELLQVKGVGPEIFNKVKDFITIYGDGTVNINTADSEVLQIIGIDKDVAEKIINMRGKSGAEQGSDTQAGGLTDADSIMEAINNEGGFSGGGVLGLQGAIGAGLLGSESYNFRGYASGRLAGKTRSVIIEFVYDRSGKTIKYWREG